MGYDLYCADGEHDGGYISFTSGALGRFKQVMHYLGMLDMNAESLPWTEPDNRAELTDDDHFALNGARGNPATPLSPAAAEYQRQERLYTDHQADEPVGIPLHKLSTNDGWLVTTQEIRAALAFYAAASPTARTAYFSADETRGWDEWIAWLERAAPRGGFRVY